MTYFRPAVPFAAFLAIAVPAAPATAQYQLAPGDSVKITVFRVPEMSGEARVDIDGNIAVPPLGNIEVAGLTVADLEDGIRSRLSGKGILEDALVTVAILEVRAVVVGGDVAQPGAIDFAAGLTVQEAVALAGGIGRMRDIAPGEAARLRGDAVDTAAELLRVRARLARIDAELSGADFVEATVVAPTEPDLRAEVVRLERQAVMSNRAEAEAELAYLQQTRDLVADHLEELDVSKARYEVRLTDQQAEVDRIGKIQDRGLTLQDRVTQERRILSDLVEESANIDATRIVSRQRYVELSHDIDRYDARRQANLATERQNAVLSAEPLAARLVSIREQLGQFGDVADENEVKVTLFRRGGDVAEALAATAETVLQPGDFIDVDVILPTRSAIRLSPADGAGH